MHMAMDDIDVLYEMKPLAEYFFLVFPSVAAWFGPYGDTAELVTLHDDDNFYLKIYSQS